MRSGLYASVSRSPLAGTSIRLRPSSRTTIRERGQAAAGELNSTQNGGVFLTRISSMYKAIRKYATLCSQLRFVMLSATKLNEDREHRQRNNMRRVFMGNIIGKGEISAAT